MEDGLKTNKHQTPPEEILISSHFYLKHQSLLFQNGSYFKNTRCQSFVEVYRQKQKGDMLHE